MNGLGWSCGKHRTSANRSKLRPDTTVASWETPKPACCAKSDPTGEIPGSKIWGKEHVYRLPNNSLKRLTTRVALTCFTDVYSTLSSWKNCKSTRCFSREEMRQTQLHCWAHKSSQHTLRWDWSKPGTGLFTSQERTEWWSCWNEKNNPMSDIYLTSRAITKAWFLDDIPTLVLETHW